MPVFETNTAWAKTPSSGKPESVSSAPAKRFVFKDSFEQAVRLYQSGRFRQAGELLDRINLKKLTIRQNRKCRFLRGSAAVRSGDSEAVLKAFNPRANVLSGLDDYAAYFRALAYSRQGRWKEVQAELKTVFYLDPEGPLKRKANLLRARTLVETGRLNLALREYRKLADGDDTGEIHLKMGLIYQQKRRLDQARLAFKHAFERAEDSKIRSNAQKRYKELLRSSLTVKKDEDLELEYIRLLRQERSLTQGLSRIDKLLSAKGSSQFMDDLAYEKGRALLLLKRRDQARKHLLQAARSAAPESKFRFLNLYADSLRWQGRTDEAASAYIRAGTEAHVEGDADSAFYRAGMLFLETDRLPEAEQAWRRMKTSDRLGNYADRILWHTAWYYYNRKVWTEALERFLALSQRFPGRELGQAAQYWLGRTFEHLGNLDEAGKHYFASAVKSQKRDYYRILSLERLREIDPLGLWSTHPKTRDLRVLEGKNNKNNNKRVSSTSRNPNFPSPATGIAYAAKDLWVYRNQIIESKSLVYLSAELDHTASRLRNLAAAGALDLAFSEAEYIFKLVGTLRQKETGDLTRKQKKQRAASLEEFEKQLFEFLSQYLTDTDRYYQYVRLQYRNAALLREVSQGNRIEVRKRLYPLSYLDKVREECLVRNLDPALVLAVIRAESFYQNQALSGSNAMGLMQIIPSTGRMVAKNLKLKSYKTSDLFYPSTNIRLGVWYLEHLLTQFNGTFPLALAAYNAGPTRVRRWINKTDGSDLEEFIEHIPFSETRNYVKKIIGYYYTYRLIYNGEVSLFNLRRALKPE